jgi:hypothetical protein
MLNIFANKTTHISRFLNKLNIHDKRIVKQVYFIIYNISKNNLIEIYNIKFAISSLMDREMSFILLKNKL